MVGWALPTEKAIIRLGILTGEYLFSLFPHQPPLSLTIHRLTIPISDVFIFYKESARLVGTAHPTIMRCIYEAFVMRIVKGFKKPVCQTL